MNAKGELIVIGCGSKKRAVPMARAIDLYQGRLFSENARVAKLAGGPHYIISALHGLIPAALMIAPYDETLQGARRDKVIKWSAMVYEQFKAIERPKTLVMICGRVYLGDWKAMLDADGWNIITPMLGLKHGQRHARINKVIGKAGKT